MGSEDKLLDLMTKMYADLKSGQDKMQQDIDDIKIKMENVDERLSKVEKTVLSIEHNHGEKLQALFDGYTQNSDKLDCIEKEVSKHDEVILRRINL